MSAQEIRRLQHHIPGGQLLDTGHDGNAASDRAERAQHAPSVSSPLTDVEQAVSHAVYRYCHCHLSHMLYSAVFKLLFLAANNCFDALCRKLADGKDEIQKYMIHREVCLVLVACLWEP